MTSACTTSSCFSRRQDFYFVLLSLSRKPSLFGPGDAQQALALAKLARARLAKATGFGHNDCSLQPQVDRRQTRQQYVFFFFRFLVTNSI